MAIQGTNSGNRHQQQDSAAGRDGDIRDNSPHDDSVADAAAKRYEEDGMTLQRGRFGNNSTRRRGNLRGKKSITASRGFQLDAGGSGTTSILYKGMLDALEEQGVSNEVAKQYHLRSISRAKYQIPFDTIAVQRNYASDDGHEYIFCHLIVVGPSRQELASTQYDIDGFEPVSLPTVASENPSEKGTPFIDQIRKKVRERKQEIFGSKAELVFVADRVIEQQFVVNDGDLKTFHQLINDAAELMESHADNFLYEATMDWSDPDLITDENGCAVACSVDYNPPVLLSATGMPIHRQMVLSVFGYDRSDTGSRNLEKIPLVDLSLYLDFNMADPESLERSDRPLYPQLIISHIQHHVGGNQLETFLIGLACIVRFKENFQYLPALDFRKIKQDDYNTLENLGYLFDEDLGIDRPGRISVTDAATMGTIADKLFSDTLEVAIECTSTNPCVGLWLDFLSSCRSRKSTAYEIMIRTLDSMAEGTGEDVDDHDEASIIIPETVPILGGYINDVDSAGNPIKYDVRRYNTTLAAAGVESDPEESVRALIHAKDGYSFEPPIAIDQQIRVLEDITNRQPVITCYHHRIFFDPNFLIPLYENFKERGLAGVIENSRSGTRRKLASSDNLRRRGVESSRNRSRHSRRDRDERRDRRRV